MRYIRPIYFLLCLSAAVLHADIFHADVLHSNDQTIIAGNFSFQNQKGYKKSLPEEWVPLLFRNISSHTEYELVKDDGITVVKAVSSASSSGIRRAITIDPVIYRKVRWRWKIMNLIKNGDVSKKSGDDYPARLYITFQYDASKAGVADRIRFNAAKAIYGEYPPRGAINYIWDNRSPEGSFIPNSYTKKVVMIVVESGERKLERWVDEERDIYEDYKKAFNEEPPLISGIAIMTDSDNTGESATAYYGDIIFRKE